MLNVDVPLTCHCEVWNKLVQVRSWTLNPDSFLCREGKANLDPSKWQICHNNIQILLSLSHTLWRYAASLRNLEDGSVLLERCSSTFIFREWQRVLLDYCCFLIRSQSDQIEKALADHLPNVERYCGVERSTYISQAKLPPTLPGFAIMWLWRFASIRAAFSILLSLAVGTLSASSDGTRSSWGGSWNENGDAMLAIDGWGVQDSWFSHQYTMHYLKRSFNYSPLQPADRCSQCKPWKSPY